jgi:hypothetical protein
MLISAHRFEHRARFSDYAVLYRGNHQANARPCRACTIRRADSLRHGMR